MTSAAPPPPPDPDQRRRFGLMVLGIGVALAALIVLLVLLNRQLWMLSFLLLVVPNIYKGLSELRASRRLARSRSAQP